MKWKSPVNPFNRINEPNPINRPISHTRRFNKSLGISGKVGTVMMAITGSFFLIAEKV